MIRLAAAALALLLAGPVAESPVADAAQRGDLEAVRALLRDGADVNAAQNDGMSALHWAARNDDAPVFEVLLYAGANTESTTRLGGYTPLHLAGRAGHALALGALAGGAIAVDPEDASGMTAMERLFLLDVALPGAAPPGRAGGRALVRFEHAPEPVAFRLFRAVRQVLLTRLAV